jgi:hypothetical protein
MKKNIYWAYSDFLEIAATHSKTLYVIKGEKRWFNDFGWFAEPRVLAETQWDGVDYLLVLAAEALVNRLPEPDRMFETDENGRLKPCQDPDAPCFGD